MYKTESIYNQRIKSVLYLTVLCYSSLSVYIRLQVDGVTGKSWTYDQLKDDIVKVGSALTKQGFKKGDVITIFSPNCPEYAIMYLAVAGIGGIVSAVNPVYTVGRFGHLL